MRDVIIVPSSSSPALKYEKGGTIREKNTTK
jgi:hypothetical protein